MKRIVYDEWQQMGSCVFIKDSGINAYGKRMGLFKCACGNEFTALITRVQNGRTTSCGCKMTKYINEILLKHGCARGTGHSREYDIWYGMIQRCYNKTSISYKYYGAKGVIVCDRWRNSFQSFLEDMGSAPSLDYSLDRFPNKHGNYEPPNCRWATASQQANNTTRNIEITYNGETKTLKEWCECLGLNYPRIRNRYKNLNWSVDKIFDVRKFR